MENIPQIEVTPTPTSADEETNAAFALAMGELIDDQTETWIRIRYGETDEQESEDDK